MMLLYKAASQDGKAVRGFIEAKDASEAAIYLRTHDLFPISITEQKDTPFAFLAGLTGRFTGGDLVFFTQQIASMLSSGLTLMQALNVLNNQVKKKAATEVINKIITDIEGGSTFSQALGAHPRAFSAIYVSLIKAGESSGLLDKVMTRLAENLEKEQRLKSQIKSALLYPAIVVIMMVVVIFIMMLFVIPQLSTLYDSLAIELPLSTQILVTISKFTVAFWPVVIISIVGSIFLLRRWYRTKSGRHQIDGAILRAPILGKLTRYRILTEFSRTLGLLVGSGGPVVGSISQAKDVAGNILFEDAIAVIAKQVEKGVSIGDAFNASQLFPPLLVQMIRVGEETGKLDDNLSRASEYFDREVTQQVKVLTTAMEPIIMATLGLGVAFLLIAVITPIYKLSSAI